jgi:hypothetical protein
MSPDDHMPRICAPTSTRTPWLAGRAVASPVATAGQAILSKKPSSSLGMKRVREA